MRDAAYLDTLSSSALASGHAALDPHPLVVLAHEPATYRSLLASELPFLRPHLRVLAIYPAELQTAITTMRPAVVVCSCRAESLATTGVAVLELHAGEVDLILHTWDGIMFNPQLSDILGAIDRAVQSEQPDTVA